MTLTLRELVFLALYVSDDWYMAWKRTGKLHYKAKALVLHDKLLNNESHRIKEGKYKETV